MYVVQISWYNRYLSQAGDALYILFRCCTSDGDRDVSNCTCDSASLCVRVPSRFNVTRECVSHDKLVHTICAVNI